MQALQWGLQQADDTKALRTQLDTIDPENKDQHKGMSKGELQGKLVGLHSQEQMKTASLNNALTQAQLSRENTAAASDTAMTSAIQAALPPVTTTRSDLQGNPADPGNPFTVNVSSRGQMTPTALMTAIAQNPQAINSPAGRQALNDWMRSAQTVQRGQPQFVKGPDGSTWAYNQYTGQFEPSALDKVKATAAAKAAQAGPPPPGPEVPPTVVQKSGSKFYYDYHLKTWKPISEKPNLFDESMGGGQAVNYTWKNGQLIRE